MTQESNERTVLSVLQLEIGLMMELGVLLREAALQLSSTGEVLSRDCLRETALAMDSRIERLSQRAAALDQAHVGTFGGRKDLGILGEMSTDQDPVRLIEQLRGALLVVCQAFAAGIVEVSDLGDDESADLLSRLSIELERDLWRLNSSVITG
ncbi:MAG: hypothetical protein K1X67_25695 [Fimbriimonadaceae bacterium]|nr:hypothetical protein [Fimbriimonadaceae bacterium]